MEARAKRPEPHHTALFPSYKSWLRDNRPQVVVSCNLSNSECGCVIVEHRAAAGAELLA